MLHFFQHVQRYQLRLLRIALDNHDRVLSAARRIVHTSRISQAILQVQLGREVNVLFRRNSTGATFVEAPRVDFLLHCNGKRMSVAGRDIQKKHSRFRREGNFDRRVFRVVWFGAFVVSKLSVISTSPRVQGATKVIQRQRKVFAGSNLGNVLVLERFDLIT